MALSLGTINFGVDADISKLDDNLNKSEGKISRFSNFALKNFGKLNNVSIGKFGKQMDTMQDKLAKNERQAQRTINQIEELESKMNSIKAKIAETSGLNLKFDTSQNTNKPMTTTNYQSQLDKLALEDAEYSKLLAKQIKLTEKSEEQGFEIARNKEKMAQLKQEIDNTSKSSFFKGGFSKVGAQVKNIGKSLKQNISMNIKMLGSMLLMSTVFGTINKAMSSALDNNEQLKANFDYMYAVLGQAITPLLLGMQNIFFNVLGIVGAIAKVFFGVDLFSKKVSTNMGKTAKSAKETNESLNTAGFDEISNISDNESSSGGSGVNVGGGAGEAMPNLDLDSKLDSWIGKITVLKNIRDGRKEVILSCVAGIGALKMAMNFGASASTLAGIVLIFVGLGFIISGLKDMIFGDFQAGLGKFLIGLGVLGLGVLLIFGAVPALIVMLIGIIIAVVIAIVRYGQEIKDKINNFFGWLDGIFSKDMTELFGPFFGNILNGFLGIFRQNFEGIRLIFVGIIDFIQGIFTGNWKQAFNGLLSILNGFKTLALNFLLAPFKLMLSGVKGVLDTVKDLWGKLWNKLKLPHIKLPHFRVSYTYDGFASKAAQFLGLPGMPKLGVDWYAKGGSFGSDSIIGVGEYIGAKSNPEVVAPQNMIYDMVIKANNDTNRNAETQNINLTNELKLNGKTLARETIQYLNDEAKRLGYKPILQKG